VVLALAALGIAACGADAPTATSDLQATVDASVMATVAAHPTATPSPDIQATVDSAVEAALNAALESAPTATPSPRLGALEVTTILKSFFSDLLIGAMETVRNGQEALAPYDRSIPVDQFETYEQLTALMRLAQDLQLSAGIRLGAGLGEPKFQGDGMWSVQLNCNQTTITITRCPEEWLVFESGSPPTTRSYLDQF
jgi:hypothetical protein